MSSSTGTVRTKGFGLVTEIEVPAAGSMMLYQPLHPVAYETRRVVSRTDGRSNLAAMENTIAEATIDVIEQDADASAPLDTTDALLDDELLVEEISIDGMCGVY